MSQRDFLTYVEAEVRKLGAALGEAVHHLWGHLFVFTVSLYS